MSQIEDELIMQQKGFSLIELLIAMMIIALLATIGMNGWQDFKARNELANTSRQLLAFLNEVKIYANTYNQNQAIHLFNLPNNQWCLAVTPETRPLACDTPFHFVPQSQHVYIAGLTDKTMLSFYGRRSTAQSGTLRLSNDIGESRIIISTRGRIRFCSYRTYLSGFIEC